MSRLPGRCLFLLCGLLVLLSAPRARADRLSPRELEQLWTALADQDAARAFRALWKLVAAPRDAVPFLKTRLPPASAPSSQQIAQWVGELDDNRFAVRKKAMEKLRALGELAEPELRKERASKPSLEARQRIDSLLDRLEGPVTSPAELQTLRAMEALEYMATPDARQVLEGLARGAPGARATREAKAALERLARQAGTRR